MLNTPPSNKISGSWILLDNLVRASLKELQELIVAAAGSMAHWPAPLQTCFTNRGQIVVAWMLGLPSALKMMKYLRPALWNSNNDGSLRRRQMGWERLKLGVPLARRHKFSLFQHWGIPVSNFTGGRTFRNLIVK